MDPAPAATEAACVSGGSNNSDGGKILTTTDPTSGEWQAIQIAGSLDFRGVSCGAPSLCVAVAREGRIFVSTDPTGGIPAWKAAGTPGGPGDLEGVSCASTLLCAAGNMTGNVLTSTGPAAGGSSWSEANAGGSVQITGVSCPTAGACVAVDNNGDVLTSADPTGGTGSWTLENLIPFEAAGPETGQFVGNALFGASCASPSLCILVGADSRIFSATDPFAAAAHPPGAVGPKRTRLRPRTHLVFAEHFRKLTITRGTGSRPGSTSTHARGPAASSASATAAGGAVVARLCATGFGSAAMTSASAPSGGPAFAAPSRACTSPSGTRTGDRGDERRPVILMSVPVKHTVTGRVLRVPSATRRRARRRGRGCRRRR